MMTPDDSASDMVPDPAPNPMPESVRADASTNRTSHDVVDEPQRDESLRGRQQDVDAVDGEVREDANTVIRDPSRASRRSDRHNRTPAAVAQILQGKHLNHFLMEEMIGGGGMGAVFRAHDDQLDREVAIKVVPFVGGDPEMQRRFRNEAQSAAKLDHPRIARVFDVGHHDDWYYIVFEYVRGINIRDWVSRTGTMRIDDAVFYTCQVAEAIQHAADRGIVHRDIKPSNVLIDDDQLVKLVDMGLARSEKMDVDDATASGVTLGTFDYISPEQARDPRAADLRSDIYSLGCTLYYMLTTQPPYPGGTMLQKLLSHGNAPPPDPRLIRKDVSAELASIIGKMLAKDPSQRYQTATDLIADLRELAFREGLTRSKGVEAVNVSQPSRLAIWLERHAPILVASTLLMLGVGWLQLMSTASRDDFKITRPNDVQPIRPTRTFSDSSSDALGTQNSTSQTDGPLPLFDPMSPPGEVSPRPSAAQTAADPPIFSVVAPEELSQPSLTEMSDRPIGDVSAFDPFQDPVLNAQGQTTPLITEFPQLVRLVGSDVPINALSESVQRDDDGAAMTNTLAHALELTELYDIDRVEIATPLVFSDPVIVRRDGLSISSSVGGTAIVLRNTPELSTKRAEMISLGSNRIEFEDLHFVWDVSDGGVDRGAVISVNHNPLVSMIDCSITIRNPSEQSDIYAFEVITAPGEATEQPTDQASTDGGLPLVAIQLDNVIVRGQMTMIHMDYAASLQLQWENGLLAVSRRMIETSGARLKPPLATAPIHLSLTYLTAHVPRGLIRMQLVQRSLTQVSLGQTVPGQFPVVIDRDSQSSVFVVDEGVPHIEVMGLEDLDNDPALLRLRGEENAYVVDPTMLDPMLLLTDTDGQTMTTQMTDLLTSPPQWAEEEKSPRWTVWWSSIRLADIPRDRLSPTHYRQDGAVFSGFDEKSLPQMPYEPNEAPSLDTPAIDSVEGIRSEIYDDF